jgi:hypothetical protein
MATVHESLFDLSLGVFAAIGLPVGTAVGLVLGILLAAVVFVNGTWI